VDPRSRVVVSQDRPDRRRVPGEEPLYEIKLPTGRMVKLRELIRPSKNIVRPVCPKCLEGALKVVAHARPANPVHYYRCGACDSLFKEVPDER